MHNGYVRRPVQGGRVARPLWSRVFNFVRIVLGAPTDIRAEMQTAHFLIHALAAAGFSGRSGTNWKQNARVSHAGHTR